VRDRVTALGGTRSVPRPDPIASAYLQLGLRIDQLLPGTVDAYFGPADLKAQVDIEPLPTPARLRSEAVALQERVSSEVPHADRRAWLHGQLVALEAMAARLAGDGLPYEQLVERLIGIAPRRHDEAVFAAARAAIEAILPPVVGPKQSLQDRLEAWDRGLEIPLDRLSGVIDWLVERYRARAAAEFGMPPADDLTVSLVTGQPWSGYEWYEGAGRSRIDINTDLPVRGPDLVTTLAHETYPGHHFEHAWKEADLIERDGRLEATMLLLNTPESLVSEGLAEVGTGFAAPLETRTDLLIELFDRAGLPIAADPSRARGLAERAVALQEPRDTLASIRGDAAFLRHGEGRSHEAVRAFLEDVGGYPRAQAEKRLEFIEHPLTSTYVFAYADGVALLERWLDAVPAAERSTRFGRPLHEQVSPASILAELG
jgi:hypothetical protein